MKNKILQLKINKGDIRKRQSTQKKKTENRMTTKKNTLQHLEGEPKKNNCTHW